ncbi:hypothetical protein GGX14DRAFT_390178 [Mycena pura]|uniref:Uncharacterized protein n=1 Tax=Mycena pura TaxID=153505 RepID=A0AAD6YFD0_9AGAR|nr:hypothetical protein GGX14DRAFT_390178 [Mycena pura]
MEISTDHRLRKFEPAHKTCRRRGILEPGWATTQIINGMAGWLAQTSSLIDINSEAYTMMPSLGVFASATAVGRIDGRRRRNRLFQNLSVVSANGMARMGIGIKDHTGLMERNGSRGSGHVLAKAECSFIAGLKGECCNTRAARSMDDAAGRTTTRHIFGNSARPAPKTRQNPGAYPSADLQSSARGQMASQPLVRQAAQAPAINPGCARGPCSDQALWPRLRRCYTGLNFRPTSAHGLGSSDGAGWDQVLLQ